MSDFVERASQYANKVELERFVTRSLRDIFGEPAASSIIYNLGGSDVLRDPKTLKSKMEAVFGIGANLILLQILRNLESSSKLRKRGV